MSKYNSMVRLKKDSGKTREQLIVELASLCRRVAELEQSEAERKQVGEQMRSSREFLDRILNSMHESVVVISPDYTIVDINDCFVMFYGKTHNEIIGRKCYEITHQNSHPCSEMEYPCPLKEVLKNNFAFNVEHIHKGKHGKDIVVEIVTFPMVNLDGEVEYIVEVQRDITERKRAEEALRESEERYRALFDSTNDIVQSVAPDGSFVFVNKAWFKNLGYTEAELPKLNLSNIIHPEFLKHCQELFARIMAGESVHNIQATFISKDGRNIQVEGSASPRIIGNSVIATQGFFRDVTERKKMEEQLIVTDRLASIGELASGIAHELNNPLTGVIGFSELLLEKNVPNEIREDIAIIHNEAVRAAEVVKNLLTFARKHTPLKQLVNINSIIASVLGLRAYEQKVSNIKIVKRLASDMPEVMADSFQLQQVFLNIVINAEYSMEQAHRGGVLTIITEREGNIIRVTFTDDGLGISEEDLGHVFDPFFTTKEVGKGTGLGLSICHGVITEHGGRIYAQSEVGKGASFIIELPISRSGRKGEKP